MTSHVLCGVDRLLAEGAAAGPVLGIETGTNIVGLGVVRDGSIAAHLARPVGSHGSDLPAAVAEVLAQAALSLDDLAGIGVASGPGSFTGLRIGMSYAKGIVMASGAKIAGASTLDALALCALHSGNAPKDGSVCALLDARRGEVYAALYRVVADGLEKITEDLVVSLESLLRHISGPVLLAGDAIAGEVRSLVNASGGYAQVLGQADLSLRGATIAALAAKAIASEHADRAATLEPLYLRPPDAALKSTLREDLSTSGRKGLWSAEKKNSSSSMSTTTKN